MKRGAHLLAPGLAGVKGKFVREFMFLLEWISMGGQETRQRERVHSCNVCDKAFKSLPNQQKIWHHSGHVFASKDCGKKVNPNNSINRHNKLVCGKHHHRKCFLPILHVFLFMSQTSLLNSFKSFQFLLILYLVLKKVNSGVLHQLEKN